MIIYNDEKYYLWDAHSHFSNMIARYLKFILKYLSIYEIIDLIFANWQRIKNESNNRLERNISFYNIILDYYHIDKAIHLPVFKMDRKLSYRMNELYKERIFGFGYINPRSKSLEFDLQELIKQKVRGIKIHPHFGKFTFQNYRKELIKIFTFCAENKIIILSHTGSHSILKNIIPILKECDDAIFIIGHSGLCPQIDQAIQVAKECPNSFLEMSGNPYTYKFIEAIKNPDIGVERILFGTDIPSLNPRVEIEKVLALPISCEEKRLIFAKNLEKVIKQVQN
ncbi:MAG: amidohydrolase family protein [Promethearchaeota archaeon]